MMDCYVSTADKTAIPLRFLNKAQFAIWFEQQSEFVKTWMASNGLQAKIDTFCLVPSVDGHLAEVIVGVKNYDEFWEAGALPTHLPLNTYHIVGEYNKAWLQQAVIAWGLGAYQFTRYKKTGKKPSSLVIPKSCDAAHVMQTVKAIFLVRDLINTPAEDLGPAELEATAMQLAKEFSGHIVQIAGDNLLDENYPAIHTVGRASEKTPRLIDLRWGDPAHTKIVIVGKGVCFDTGGLDLKTAASMLCMKKDMGGAAHALALAYMIMKSALPVSLRVLIPAVENAVSGSSYRPGDVVKTRKGLTVEITNTDAEGRVILADALTEACAEKPALIIDFATLTGAARVSLGTDLPALFTDDEALAVELLQCAQQESDPLWRMPLHKPYRKMIDSQIADINNSPASSYAGAITAALFLKEFVDADIPWVHIDLMAWNVCSRPGRPEGGEAMSLRAVFRYLSTRFQGDNHVSR